MTARRLPSLLVLLAAVAAPLIGYGQIALDLGQPPAEFAAQGDATLRIAPYAFSIWGVIYLWLAAMGMWQALASARIDDVGRNVRLPAFLSLSGIALWVVATAADLKWLTVAIILVSLGVLLLPLLRNAPRLRAANTPTRRWMIWPLALLAGWLTLASIANILSVATAEGLLPAPPASDPIAVAALALAALVGLIVTARLKVWTYPVPIVWGLIGAFVAERADGDMAKAWAALIAAGVMALGAALILLRRRG